jgi:nitrite reductase [NAD(P)H] small subunit
VIAATEPRRAGRAADIPFLEGRSVTLDGERLAIFHTESGFVALGGVCPHKEGPLADGLVADSCVTCPLHGWRIDLLTGEVVAGGEGSVPVYEVEDRGGELYVKL